MVDVAALFRRHRDDVYRLALSYTRSPQEAEDVCQTVFLKLLEQPNITPGKEKAWLMQVTANECRSLLRSAWWKRTAPLEECTAAAPGGSGILQDVLDLPPKYRVVIYLHYYECCTTAEIAKLLKISQTAVTTRLARGRQMLQAKIKEV